MSAPGFPAGTFVIVGGARVEVSDAYTFATMNPEALTHCDTCGHALQGEPPGIPPAVLSASGYVCRAPGCTAEYVVHTPESWARFVDRAPPGIVDAMLTPPTPGRFAGSA